MNYNVKNEDAVLAVDFKPLKVSSSAFTEGGFIPSKYTCDGENINPPLEIKGVPEETKCLAIVVEDPVAPIRSWQHWIAWNIHSVKHIKAGREMEAEGRNDFGENKYSGPCPFSGAHHYYFKVYALDSLLDMPTTSTKRELEKSMSEHIIGFGQLSGVYERK